MLLSAVAALAPPALAGPVRVTGTAVSMEPPPGFAPAARYPGFEHPEHGASIMVTEIPGPFSAISKGMTKEGLASRGMRLLDSREVELGEHRGLLRRSGPGAQRRLRRRAQTCSRLGSSRM